jgi:hypothetical protein
MVMTPGWRAPWLIRERPTPSLSARIARLYVLRSQCGDDPLAPAPLRKLLQLPARVTDGVAQCDVDISMQISVPVLIVGVNVCAWDMHINLHHEQPGIRMLVMTSLDGQMAFADSIIVSPEFPR